MECRILRKDLDRTLEGFKCLVVITVLELCHAFVVGYCSKSLIFRLSLGISGRRQRNNNYENSLKKLPHNYSFVLSSLFFRQAIPGAGYAPARFIRYSIASDWVWVLPGTTTYTDLHLHNVFNRDVRFGGTCFTDKLRVDLEDAKLHNVFSIEVAEAFSFLMH